MPSQSVPRPGFDLGRRALLAAGGALAAGATAQAAAPSPLSPPWTSEGFIRRPGSTIHYVSLGEGATVVLLHKLGGEVADWRKVAPLLAAKGRRVIAIDLPGHGASTILGPPPLVVTVPETAATIKAVLDELQVVRCPIIGNSLGGCVGLVMAAFWPDAVSKLGLVSVSLIPAMTMAAIRQQDIDRKAEFAPDGSPLPRTAADIAAVGFRDPEVQREDDRSRAKAGVWVRPSERGVGLAGVSDYLPRVQAPTLLLLGDMGRYVKYEAIARQTLKSVQVVKVPDSGSFVHQEKPAQAAAAINAFLDS